MASLAARYGATAHTVTALAAPRQWLDGWRQLLEGLPGVTASPGAVVGIAIGTAVAIAWLWRTDALPPWRPAAAICRNGASVTWLVVGTSLWVGMNRYAFRYMYPTLMIAGVGVSTVVAALFARRPRALTAVAFAMLAAATVVRYGTPSLARVERDVGQSLWREDRRRAAQRRHRRGRRLLARVAGGLSRQPRAVPDPCARTRVRARLPLGRDRSTVAARRSIDSDRGGARRSIGRGRRRRARRRRYAADAPAGDRSVCRAVPE